MSGEEALRKSLREHLIQVQDDQNTTLDEHLLQQCEVFLVPQILKDPHELKKAVEEVAKVIPFISPRNPKPFIRLLSKLLKTFTFSQLFSLDPPVDFVTALSVDAQPYNTLGLDMLEKATVSAKDAAHLAALPALVHSLVTLWLSTPEIGDADRAGTMLVDLLKIDKEPSEVSVHGVGNDGKSGGQGLMWRRIFGDKDVYRLLFMIPNLKSSSAGFLGKREKTIAQARLMTFVVKVGKLDWSYITRSHHPEIEKSFGLDPDREGLLDYVSKHLIDIKDDVLMHISLIQFFGDLISTVQTPSMTKNISVSLEYLREQGLHQRTSSFWLTPDNPNHDSLDREFLYGPSAHYFADYISEYPQVFLSGPEVSQVLLQLFKTLDVSANQLVHGRSPKYELNVLTILPSLPRVTLLPQRHLGDGTRSSPLLLIPCKITSTEALYALGRVFNGVKLIDGIRSHSTWIRNAAVSTGATISEQTTTDAEQIEKKAEAAAARALYIAYLHYHNSFLSDLVNHAETIALPEKALAAINLLLSIAQADWSELPEENSFNTNTSPKNVTDLPSEAVLLSLLPRQAGVGHIQTNGAVALIRSPGSEKVLSWALRPPKTFSNLVGGRGEAENAAYQVAMAKWDFLQLLHNRLRLVAGGDIAITAWLRSAERSLAEGPWGSGSAVGGRIATLEL